MALTREPDQPLAVGALIAGAAVAVASAITQVALVLEERSAALARPRRRAPRRGRAVRRGLGLGAAFAVLALLRAVDGLTILTGGFVVAGFALAELVLSARPATRSG